MIKRYVLLIAMCVVTACITINVPPQPTPGGASPAPAPNAPMPPPSTVTKPPATQSAPASKIVFDSLVMNKTPQTGTWLFCFTGATPEGVETLFNVPDKEYSGDGINIPMNVELDGVVRGDTVTYTLSLDNDQADVCSGQASEQATGSFVAGRKGSIRGSSGTNWSWVLNYHIE